APAVERPGIHLGVWRDENELYVWGATRFIPSLGFVLEDIEPGVLVIKHRPIDGFGKFSNVPVLKGEQIKIVDEQGTSLPDCPDLLKSLLAFTAPATWDSSVNVLVQLAASMRAHGHGGTLVVVPHGTQLWRESIVHPIIYSVAPSFSKLAALMKKRPNVENENDWLASLSTPGEPVAVLRAVVAATVISDEYEVLAFGEKMLRARGGQRVEQFVLPELVVGNEAVTAPPVQHGGTRHLS